MENYKSPYIRLQFYNSMLINNDDICPIDDDFECGLPIRRLAELSDIPIEIIREDVAIMLNWRFHLEKCHLKFYDSYNLYYKNILFFEFQDNQDSLDDLDDPNIQKELINMILKGEMDDIPIYMNNSPGKNDEEYLLSITSAEMEALQFLAKDDSNKNNTQQIKNLSSSCKTIIHSKDCYRYNHLCKDLISNLDIINQAILSNDCLHIKYKISSEKILRFDFKPLKISFDSDTNNYTVISVYNGKLFSYQLDRIEEIKEVRKSTKPVSDQNESLLRIAPCVWGNSFSDPPVHVKVKFYNEAKVWQKVKQDLTCRTKGSLKEIDNFLYYKNTVYGINKFCS